MPQHTIPKAFKRAPMQAPLRGNRMVGGAMGKIAVEGGVVRPAALGEANPGVVAQEDGHGLRALGPNQSPDAVNP